MRTPSAVLIAALLGICHPGATAQSAWPRADLLGSPAAPDYPARTIVIGPRTRHVNVVRNEVIRFDVDGKLFAWTFNGPLAVNAVELNRVAPPGVLTRPVTVYISPDPLIDTPSL